MSDSENAILITPPPEGTPPSPIEESKPSPVRFVRRFGCIVLLIIWFGILLLPCLFLVLATQGQITISQGGLPGQQFRIWLVMEEELRGVGISNTSTREKESLTCLQTDVRYIMWQGSGDAVTFCDCFSAAVDENSNETEWLLAETYQGACVP